MSDKEDRDQTGGSIAASEEDTEGQAMNPTGIATEQAFKPIAASDDDTEGQATTRT